MKLIGETECVFHAVSPGHACLLAGPNSFQTFTDGVTWSLTSRVIILTTLHWAQASTHAYSRDGIKLTKETFNLDLLDAYLDF